MYKVGELGREQLAETDIMVKLLKKERAGVLKINVCNLICLLIQVVKACAWGWQG